MIQPYNLQSGFSKDEFDAFLAFAYENGTSDISISSGQPIKLSIHGANHIGTTRNIMNAEIGALSAILYQGDNAISIMGGGTPLDPRYEFRLNREKSLGFRVSMAMERGGVAITMRVLPDVPRHLRELCRPADLTDSLFSERGLVLVAGVTSSGKSTLLAGTIRQMLEESRNEKILTYEQPVEYVYDGVSRHDSNLIWQFEIGEKIKTFEGGLRHAMRNSPTTILVGEMRDRVTISAGIEAVLTGHKTFSTVHAETAGITLSRTVQTFDYPEHSSITEKLISSTRLIVVQRLVPRADGAGRIAVNEWFSNDATTARKLSACRPDEVALKIDAIVRERGTSFAHHAAYYAKKGLISVPTASKCSGASLMEIEKIMRDLKDDLYATKEELNGCR